MITDSDILQLVRDGGKLDAIADLTGRSRGEVVKIARLHGMALNQSTGRFVQAMDAVPVANASPRTSPRNPSVAAVPHGRPTAATEAHHPVPVQQLAPVTPIRPIHRDALAAGHDNCNANIRKVAARAQQSLDRLVSLLDRQARQDAAVAAKAAEKAVKAEHRQRVDRLRRELYELTGTTPKASTPRPRVGVGHAQVRAWAKEQGIPVADRGRPSNAVVAAWRAAGQDTEAAS